MSPERQGFSGRQPERNAGRKIPDAPGSWELVNSIKLLRLSESIWDRDLRYTAVTRERAGKRTPRSRHKITPRLYFIIKARHTDNAKSQVVAQLVNRHNARIKLLVSTDVSAVATVGICNDRIVKSARKSTRVSGIPSQVLPFVNCRATVQQGMGKHRP